MAPKRKAPTRSRALSKKVAAKEKQQKQVPQHKISHQENEQQASMISSPAVYSPKSPNTSATYSFLNNGSSNATPGNTKQSLFQQVVRKNANANTTEALRNSAGLMDTMIETQNNPSFDSFIDPTLASHDQRFMGGEASLDDFMANLSDPASLNTASSSIGIASVQEDQNMMKVCTQIPQMQIQYPQQQTPQSMQFQPNPNKNSGFGLGLQIPGKSTPAHHQHTRSLSGSSITHSLGFTQLNSFNLPQDMTDIRQFPQPAQMASLNFSQDMPGFDQLSQTSYIGSFNGSNDFTQDISNSAQSSEIAQTTGFSTSQSAVDSMQLVTPTKMGSLNFHPTSPNHGFNQSFLTPDQILAMRRTRSTSFTFPQAIPQIGAPAPGSLQGVVNTSNMSNDFMSSSMIANCPLNVDYNNLDFMNLESLNSITMNNIGMNTGGIGTGNMTAGGGMNLGKIHTSGMVTNATSGWNTGISNSNINTGDMNTTQMNFGGQNIDSMAFKGMQSNAVNTSGSKLNASGITSSGITTDRARETNGENTGRMNSEMIKSGDLVFSFGRQPGAANPEVMAAFQQKIQTMTPDQRQSCMMQIYLMDFKKQLAFLGHIQPTYRTIFERGINYIQQWCSFERQRRDLIGSVNQDGLQQPAPSQEQQAQLRALMEHLRLLENDFYPTDPIQAQRQLRILYNQKHGQPAPSNQQRQSQQRARTPSNGSGPQNPRIITQSPRLLQTSTNIQAMSPPKHPNLIQSRRAPSHTSVSQHPQNNMPSILGDMGTQLMSPPAHSNLSQYGQTLSSGSAGSPQNFPSCGLNPRARKDSYNRDEVEKMITQAALWGQKKERAQNLAQNKLFSSSELADADIDPTLADPKLGVNEQSRSEDLENQRSVEHKLVRQTKVLNPNTTPTSGHLQAGYQKEETSVQLTGSPTHLQNLSPQPVNRRAATQEKVIQKAIANGLAKQGLASPSRSQSLTPSKSQASPYTLTSCEVAEAQEQLATPRRSQNVLQLPQLEGNKKTLSESNLGSLNNHEIASKMQQDLNDVKLSRQDFKSRQVYEMNMLQQHRFNRDQLLDWEQAVQRQPLPDLSNDRLAGLNFVPNPADTGTQGSISQQMAYHPQTGAALSSMPTQQREGKVQFSSKDSESEPQQTPKPRPAANSLKLSHKIPQKASRREHMVIGSSNSNDQGTYNSNAEVENYQQGAPVEGIGQGEHSGQVQVNMNASQSKVAIDAVDNGTTNSTGKNQQASNSTTSNLGPRRCRRPQKNNLSTPATPEPTPRALPKTLLKEGNSNATLASGLPFPVTEEEKIPSHASIKEIDKHNPLLNGGELKTPSRFQNIVGSSPPAVLVYDGQDHNENNEVLELPTLPRMLTCKTPIKVLNKLGSSLGDTPDSVHPMVRIQENDAAMALPKNISRGFKVNPGRATTSGPVKREWRELPDDAESSHRPMKRRALPPPPLELTNTNLGDFEAYSAATKYPRIRTPRDWQDAVARSDEVDTAVAMSDGLLSEGLFTSGDRNNSVTWLAQDYENHEILEIIGPAQTSSFVSLSDLYNPSSMEQILHRNLSKGSGLGPLLDDPVVQTKKVRSVLKLLEWQVGDHIKVHGDSPDDEDLCRKKLVSSLLKSASEENEKLEKQSTVPPYFRPAPKSDPLKLAVSHIKKGHQYDPYVDSHLQILCSFCCYGGDYGVVDESVRMDEDAFAGYCADCYVSSREFENELMTGQYRFRQGSGNPPKTSISERLLNNQPVPLKEIMDNLDLRNKALDFCQSFKIQGRGPFFASDGNRTQNITSLMSSLTCRSSPYGQVDVNKALICDPCKLEKLNIIGHRHIEFQSIAEEGPFELQDFAGNVTLGWEPKARRCMICVSSAAYVCTVCPLRLCERCKDVLRKECKGWLDNLFYFYKRLHLRNDAFLLRADGGGF
ncbi:hypothetical protein BGZ60DRAFT_524973 [Tricladium varicosporioides]|nr:hypothetical protein BGZ60DRAFT_524973 [Hymenoscyphus varicosporioides]